MTPEMNEEKFREILAEIQSAGENSRGYATYWDWPLDRQQAEVGVVSALADFLAHRDGTTWKALRPVEADPPDVLLTSTTGRNIGVEVTEIVDAIAVKEHRFAKQNSIPRRYWAEWSSERLKERMTDAIRIKDEKIRNCRASYDDMFLAIMTDEPLVDFNLAKVACANFSVKVENLTSAFLLLSYHPSIDKECFPNGIPVFQLNLS